MSKEIYCTLKPAQDDVAWWLIMHTMTNVTSYCKNQSESSFYICNLKELSLYMNQSEGGFWTKSLWQEITTENERKKYMKSVWIYKEEQSAMGGPGW